MKTASKLFLLVACIIFSSCAFLLGIRTPKELTKKELDLFLIKKNIDTLNCFAFRQKAYDSIKRVEYKPGWEKGFKPLQYKAFDKSGKLISQYASCEGNLKKLELLKTYPPKNIFPFDTTQTLQNDITMYRTYRGEKLIIEQEKYDIIFVVYWGKWLGRPGINLLKNIYEYRKFNKNKNILILKVNVEEIYS